MKTFTFLKTLFSLTIALIFTINANSQGNPFGCNQQFFINHSSGTAKYTNGAILDSLAYASSIFSVGQFSNSSNLGYNAIGLNPKDGYIYAVSYQSGSSDSRSHLIKIGRTGTTSVETDLGDIHVGGGYITGGDALAGCFDFDGTYYFSANSKLYKIPNASLSTASATSVGSTSSFADIAINPVTGQMYGSNGGSLYSINKTTGTSSSIHSFSPSVSLMAGLFFNATGSLYGYSSDGNFYLINLTNASLTSAGTGPSYSNADGASCSFGQVFHTMAASFNNQLCPTSQTPNPIDTLTVAVTNQTSVQQTGLTYTLEMPGNRFSFNQTATTIAANLYAAGVIPANNPALVTISSTTGTNNKLVVTSFQTGVINTTLTFKLQIKLVTLGGTYAPVSMQSTITGLPAYLGIDYSDDPNTVAPDDPTTIGFCAGITLPVKLLSFSGIYKNNATQLNWEADNQVNFSGYDLERSTDGATFNSIDFASAQTSNSATQSYQYIDDLSSLNDNVFYYRLKMVDLDGKFSYSNIIMVRKDQQNINGISINPNPVINDMATVRFTAITSGIAEIRIINLTGQIVMRQQNNIYEGTNSISVNNLSHLQPGIYLIQVANGNNLLSSKFSLVK